MDVVDNIGLLVVDVVVSTKPSPNGAKNDKRILLPVGRFCIRW
jgi:hypothetical protein